MKREILCTPKKDRGQFSCVFLQKPGLVRPLPPSASPFTLANHKLLGSKFVKSTSHFILLALLSQRRWPTAGSTTNSPFSWFRTGAALSPRGRETCTSLRWKLRMQETTPVMFLVPSPAKVSSPSSFHSSLCLLMKVTAASCVGMSDNMGWPILA